MDETPSGVLCNLLENTMTHHIERQRTGHFNLYINGRFHSQHESWSDAFSAFNRIKTSGA